MVQANILVSEVSKRALRAALVSVVLLACLVIFYGCSGDSEQVDGVATSSDAQQGQPSYQAVVVSDTLEERGIYCVQTVDGLPSSGLFILTPPENPEVDPASLKAGDLLDVHGSAGMTMSLPGLANCSSFELVGTVEGADYEPFQEAWDEFPGKPAL